MDDYDRRYRPDNQPYGGDGKLEIVSYSGIPPRPWMPDPPLPPPPPAAPPRRSTSGSSSGSGWGFNDAEMKRRRRVASYKAYSVEGKVKASLRKGFRWIKTKCSELVHGW